MTDEATPSPQPPTNNPPQAPAWHVPDMAAFFAALGNPLRWKMVQLLADGRDGSAIWFAKKLARDFDGVSKHLHVLAKARVVSWKAGEDQRLRLYFIPESVRRADGVLDYGNCLIRVTPVA